MRRGWNAATAAWHPGGGLVETVGQDGCDVVGVAESVLS